MPKYITTILFIGLFLALAFTASVVQAQTIPSGFTEGDDGNADASSIFAWASVAGSMPIRGSLPVVNGVRDADTFALCNSSTVPTIDRWYAQTPISPGSGVPYPTQTYLSHNGAIGQTFWAELGGNGDLRSNFTGLLNAADCYHVGVSQTGSNGFPLVVDNPLRIDVSMSNYPTVPAYTLTSLASRRIRASHIMVLPQQEINDLSDPRIPTIECNSVEVLSWIYEARGDYNPDVERIMVRLGPSCSGYYARTYGNVQNDVVELRPDGSVVQARVQNIFFNDFANQPGLYPTPVPFQNGRDWGASGEIALTAGNYLMSGNLLLDDNGPVREPTDCATCVNDRGNAQPVRRSQQLVLLYRPTVTFASNPVSIGRDLNSGAEVVRILRTDSRQVSAYEVSLPDLGVIDTLRFVTPANAGVTWSQAGAFTDLLYLPTGTLPATGTPVRVVVTPLGSGAHWDYTRVPNQAIDVTTAVAVADESDPTTASDLNLSVYPNPIRSVGTVQFTLDNATDVSVSVYDVMGRQVTTVHDGALATGTQTLRFDPRGLASGVYVVRLRLGDGGHATARLIVMR